MKECRNAGMQKCRNTGMQNCSMLYYKIPAFLNRRGAEAQRKKYCLINNFWRLGVYYITNYIS